MDKWPENDLRSGGLLKVFYSISDTELLASLLVGQYRLISQILKLRFISDFLNCPASSSTSC